MIKTFAKVYGVDAEQNKIIRFRATKCLVIYGYGTDDMGGYNYRKYYDHEPTTDEIRTDIEDLINAETDERILNGWTWEGTAVYLSAVNQANFTAAFLAASQTEGGNLPLTMKIGEEDGEPRYVTFEDVVTLQSFYTSMEAHITSCLSDGWAAKDAVDYSVYVIE